MKHKKLPVTVYAAHMHVLVGTAAEINRWFRRNYPGADPKEEKLQPRTVGLCSTWEPDNEKLHGQYFVCVATDRCVNREERRATLVHELVHLSTRVLDNKGVQYNADNSEALAYFHEWLYQESIGMVG